MRNAATHHGGVSPTGSSLICRAAPLNDERDPRQHDRESPGIDVAGQVAHRQPVPDEWRELISQSSGGTEPIAPPSIRTRPHDVRRIDNQGEPTDRLTHLRPRASESRVQR